MIHVEEVTKGTQAETGSPGSAVFVLPLLVILSSGLMQEQFVLNSNFDPSTL